MTAGSPAEGGARRTEAQAAGAVGGGYCDHCGRSVDADDHAFCHARRQLEPPRYCTLCRRRMVVQVVPRGWTARCSVHGQV